MSELHDYDGLIIRLGLDDADLTTRRLFWVQETHGSRQNTARMAG